MGPPRLTQDPQNYIATTSVSPGRFWRDGFRAADGKTREFVFTEDASRGVAAQVIGEDRVDAFGVSLFLSREPSARLPPVLCRGGGLTNGGYTKSATKSAGRAGRGAPEVAAGALVNQNVEHDGRRLDFWQEQPSATFVIYYCNREEFARITAAGAHRGEGWLPGPAGNP